MVERIDADFVEEGDMDIDVVGVPGADDGVFTVADEVEEAGAFVAPTMVGAAVIEDEPDPAVVGELVVEDEGVVA